MLLYNYINFVLILGYGVTTDGYTTYINASTCTVKYKPDNPPVVFDFPIPEGHSKQEVVNLTIKQFGDQEQTKRRQDEEDEEVEFKEGDEDEESDLNLIP